MNFLFDGYIKASIAKNKTGTPRNEGIKDVIELVELKEFTVNPQIIRNIPQIIEIDSIFKPINLYSF